MEIPIVKNSSEASINQRKANISSAPTKTFNIYAIINMLKEKTAVFIPMSMSLFFTKRAIYIVIPKDNAVCNTPKMISAFVGENTKLARNTPTTIPKKYFLFKTIKWLNNSEIRNWIPKNPNGATTAVTTK